MTRTILRAATAVTVLVLLADPRALAEEDEDARGKGPATLELRNASDKSVQVTCGGAAILSHQMHPSRRFALLECYDGKKCELFTRLVQLERGRSLKLAFGSFSPDGSHGAFKRWGLSGWDPLQLVPLRDIERYMASGGRAGAVSLGARKSRPGDCAHAIEFDRWMAGDILRYARAACGTDSLYDYCAASRTTMFVARSVDGSDMARARRRQAPPIPSPCSSARSE